MKTGLLCIPYLLYLRSQAYDAVREREGKSREPGCLYSVQIGSFSRSVRDPDPDPAPPLRSPAVVVVVASSSLSPSGTFPLDPHLFLDLVFSPAAPSRSRFVSLLVSVPLYPLSLPSRAPLPPKHHRLLRPQTPHQQLRHPRLQLRLLHWVRWDASPNRDLIHHAIEAFEEENAAKEEVSFRNPPVRRSGGGGGGGGAPLSLSISLPYSPSPATFPRLAVFLPLDPPLPSPPIRNI